MYLYLTKSLLPLFLLFSYLVVPVMAEEDREVVGGQSEQIVQYDTVKDGLCAVDKDFFANHPEYDGLSQADVLTAGTQIDVTGGVLRLIPKDQRCSKEIKFGDRES
jgi:hypothetical protein